MTQRVRPILIALLACHPVAAEPVDETRAATFAHSASQLRGGETLLVTQVSGDLVRGRVLSTAPLTLKDPQRVASGGERESLGVASIELTAADVEKLVVIRKDSLWNGTLIGLGVGAAVVFAADCNSPECDDLQTVAVPLTLVLGAGLGALIDSLKKHEKLLYAAAPKTNGTQVSIAPLIGPARRGVLFTIQWGR